MPLHPDLAVLVTEIDANLSRAGTLTSGLSHEQFNWRPEPGRWSIGECLVHLNIANHGDLASLEAAIADGRARGLTGPGPYRYGFLSRKFIASQDLPIKRKFKAPKSFVPPAEADLEKTLADYTRIKREIRRFTQAADGLDLARVKVPLWALPAALRLIVKMPLGALLALITTHDRRHLWQAEQVRSDPRFPCSGSG